MDPAPYLQAAVAVALVCWLWSGTEPLELVDGAGRPLAQPYILKDPPAYTQMRKQFEEMTGAKYSP